MAEQRTPANVHTVDMVCDKCKKGFMRPGATVLMSDPPQYPHKCTECGHQANYGTIYPSHRLTSNPSDTGVTIQFSDPPEILLYDGSVAEDTGSKLPAE